MFKTLNFKKLLSTFLVLLTMSIYGFAQLQPVAADSIWDRIVADDEGGLEEIGDTVFGETDEPRTIPEIVARIIKYLFTFLGIIFLALIIYGGFLYMTAGGDSEQTGKAKDIIISATIGLAIILASYAFTYFVIENLTKATGTN